MGGIAQNFHPVFMGNLHNFVIIAGRTEDVYRNDGLQIEFPFFLDFFNCFFQVCRIHRKRVRCRINKNRRGAKQDDAFCRSDKRKRRNKNSIAGFDIPGHKSQRQGICTGSICCTIFCSRILGEFFFQFSGFRSLTISAVVKNGFERI